MGSKRKEPNYEDWMCKIAKSSHWCFTSLSNATANLIPTMSSTTEMNWRCRNWGGGELTTPMIQGLCSGGELRRWGLMIGASERGETTNHGLQSRDAERLHGVEESSRCRGLPVSPPREEKEKRRKTTLLLQPTWLCHVSAKQRAFETQIRRRPLFNCLFSFYFNCQFS